MAEWLADLHRGRETGKLKITSKEGKRGAVGGPWLVIGGFEDGGHDEVVFAAEVDAGVQFERFGLNVTQAHLAGDDQEVKLHLETGKALADAVSGSGRKWDRRQAMPIVGAIGIEAARIETVRIGPNRGMPLDEVGRNINFGSRRNEVVA